MKKINSASITITKKLANEINYLLRHGDPSFGEDLTIVKTAVFDNGYEMDIKCCGVQYEEGEVNTAWTEAVLFHNGSEVCCSDPCDEFVGEWELSDGDNVYVVNVSVEEE